MITTPFRLLAASVLTLLMSASANAQVILLNDTFDLPGGTATHLDDLADPNDTAWRRADQQTSIRPGLEVGTDGLFFGGSGVLQVTPNSGAQRRG